MDKTKETVPQITAPVSASAEIIRVPVEKDGRWIVEEVPAEQAEKMSDQILEMVERDDRYEHAIDLGPEWYDRRGTEFHAYLAHNKPEHRSSVMAARYRPVDPTEFKEHRGQVMNNVKGFEGINVIVYGGELVLMETPKQVWEYRQARDLDRGNAERFERTQTKIAEANEELLSKTGGKMSIKETRGLELEAMDDEGNKSRQKLPFAVHGQAPREVITSAAMELQARMRNESREEIARQIERPGSQHGGFTNASWAKGPKPNFGYRAG